MRIKNKLVLAGLLFNLLGCSTPLQVGADRNNPALSQTIENSAAKNFKALQDSYNTSISGTKENISLKKTNEQTGQETTIPLVFDKKPATILFDTGKNPMGLTDKYQIKPLDSLKKILVKYNFNPVFTPLSEQKELEKFDVIALISPSLEYTPSEINILTGFVKSGKKVVITGEWGGYSGFDANSVNNFLKQVNLRINQDLVRETEKNNYKTNTQQLLVSIFHENPVTENIKKLALFSTASIEIIDGSNLNQARILAQSTNNSYKIQNAGNQAGLVAMANFEKGQVIVVGDTSLFTDQQVNSNGKVNLEEENNEQFALNIFSK